MAVSRATLTQIEAFKQRMRWQFDWVSSSANDFHRGFQVSFDPEDRVDGEVAYNYGKTQGFATQEAPGIRLFVKGDANAICHNFSTLGRGVKVMKVTRV